MNNSLKNGDLRGISKFIEDRFPKWAKILLCLFGSGSIVSRFMYFIENHNKNRIDNKNIVRSFVSAIIAIIIPIFYFVLMFLDIDAILKNDTFSFRRTIRFNFRGSLCMPYGLFMALFVVLPLLLIIYYAFTDADGNFVLSNWKTVFVSAENWRVIGITFAIAAATTVICILIAYPIAYVLSNKKFNKNKVLVYIFLLPMWINFVIRTNALKDLLNGMTSSIFGWDITSEHPFASIIIGMVYDYLPFAILPLYNQMLKMDKNQIEAAADLGANPFLVFVKTIIPMTIPGIVSACMMTFMPTMSSYVIADKMSENSKMIIGSLIQNYFLKSTNKIAMHVGSVLSLVMLLIVGLTLLAEKLISGKGGSKKEGIW